MTQTLTDFEMTSLLVDFVAIREYLGQVVTEGDEKELLRAIRYVAQVCKTLGKKEISVVPDA
ncbi:hypothetical protein [Pseudomonas sp. McL0111]|uniref:hypothetical protein n=1 Tax=Pseudomonas sp. McL0111 TaxID=3457357 RepID=UPI00403E958F